MFFYAIAFTLSAFFIYFANEYYKKQFLNLVLLNGKTACIKASNNKKYILFEILAFLPLFLVSALRYGIGTDYFFTYVPNFFKILQGESFVYTEIGFILINKFIQLFSTNYQWVFVITSFVFCAFFINSATKYSNNAVISVFVLFISCVFFISLNNVRQAVAAIIIASSYPYIAKGNAITFAFFIFCAIIFHITAVIMLIPFAIINIKAFKKYFEAFACIALFSLPIICKIFVALLKNTKYYYYFLSHFNSGDVSYITIAYHLIFFLVAYFILKDKINFDNKAFALLIMQYFALFVSCAGLFIKIPEMITRIALFFQVFHLFLVPYCLEKAKTFKLKACLCFGYTGLYLFFLSYYVVILGYYEVLPYKWIFQIK